MLEYNITLYSINGDIIEQFVCNEVITVYSNYPQSMLYVKGYVLPSDPDGYQIIAETNLPYISESYSHENKFKGCNSKYHIQLFAANGKIVKEFDCVESASMYSLYFYLTDGKVIATSLFYLKKEIKK